MLHLTLFTTFLTAVQTFSSFTGARSPGDVDYQLHQFTEFGVQVEYFEVTPNESEFDYNCYEEESSGNEYLIQNGAFVFGDNVTGNEDRFGGFWFHCEIPEELRNTENFPLADNNGSWTLFDFYVYKDIDDEYGNNVVCEYYPNIKNFLFNATFSIRLDFLFRDYTDHMDQVDFGNRYGFSYDIPLYVQNYGGSTVWALSSYLSDLCNGGFSANAEDLVCMYSVVFSVNDFSDIKQQWYDEGYLDGKNDGVILGGNTSFTKLLSNIADIPILILRKLFGYDVLGVNIYGALATVMSLIVALAIFRFIRGVF